MSTVTLVLFSGHRFDIIPTSSQSEEATMHRQPENVMGHGTSEDYEHVDQASNHFHMGRLYYLDNEYDEAVDEFQACLSIKEATIGRYELETADVYDFIGDCFCKRGDIQNSLVGYHTCLRIRRRLSIDLNMQAMNYYCSMEETLEKIRLTKEEIEVYNSKLSLSVNLEIEGDRFLEEGVVELAIERYREAIAAEESALPDFETLKERVDEKQGNAWWSTSIVMTNEDSDGDFQRETKGIFALDGGEEKMLTTERHPKVTVVTTAFLWRKMASIYCTLESGNLATMDWNQADRIGGTWIIETSFELSGAIKTFIQRGDNAHAQGKYCQALDTYRMACEFFKNVVAVLKSSLPQKSRRTFGQEILSHEALNDALLTESVSSKLKDSLKAVIGRLADIEESVSENVHEMRLTLISCLDAMIRTQRDFFKSFEKNSREDTVRLLEDKISDIEDSMRDCVDGKMEDLHHSVTKDLDEALGILRHDILEHVEKTTEYVKYEF